jgi:tetratricopeptide (TPR) repeat protein
MSLYPKTSFSILPLLLVLTFGFCDEACGSPKSRELLLKGHADLAAGNYQEALKKFTAGSQADPKDAEIAYFEGAALNRMGRFRDALVRLEQAAATGFRSPGLTFDTGWALLRVGRWQDAVVQLEQFEKTVPGRGKTSEFLGQAYLGMREYGRAEAKLQEAIQREAKLKPTALLYLAALERERKNREAAKRHIETLMREVADSPVADILKQRSEWRPGTETKSAN